MKSGVILRIQPGLVVSELLRGRALSRLRRDLDKPETVTREPLHGRPWLDSERVVRCAEADCPAVYEADGPPTCPRCGSHQAVPVARLLNETLGWTKPEPEAS